MTWFSSGLPYFSVVHQEFKDLRFKDGDSIEDFVLRFTWVVADLELYRDPVTEHKAVQKFLRVAQCKYRRMAMAIESLINLKTMMIDELTDHARCVGSL